MDNRDTRKRGSQISDSVPPTGTRADAPRAKEPEVVTGLDALDAEPLDTLDGFFYRDDEDLGELPDINADADEVVLAEEAPRELLAFELVGEEYAVDIARIREIVKVPPITEVPRAPRDVLGVMSLRGEILPVFDLRRRLGLPPLEGEPSRRARVLVVDAGEGHAGILVDAVAHVVRLKPSGIEPTPQGLGGGVESEYLAGIGRQKNRLYILLDVQAVLARAGGRQP